MTFTGSATSSDSASLADRARNFVEFLIRLAQMRAATVRDIDRYDEVVWFSDVPEAPGCRCVANDHEADDLEWIAVERPRMPPQPQPPLALREWLVEPDSDQLLAEPTLVPESPDGAGIVPPPEARGELERYLERWRPWATEYEQKMPVHELYQRLFRMRQQAEQLGEVFELVVGAGLAMTSAVNGEPIRRHVLTMRADITYHSDTGRIVVGPAADGLRLQFEEEMLDPVAVPPKDIREHVQARLLEVAPNVWEGSILADALAVWTNASGADSLFLDSNDRPTPSGSRLLVSLAPALILRRRSERSLIAFYRAIDEQLAAGIPVPTLMAGLVTEPEGSVIDTEPVNLADEAELFFPKPYNREQLEVLRRLEASEGVVTVGPPGTGKSHTIANLLSHLLAHGQRVLVTSHTSRALEVLLDKLPDDIRMLSVSLVGDGRTGMRELQRSVEALVQRSTDPDWHVSQIDERIARLQKARADAEESRAKQLERLRAARESETRTDYVLDPGAYRGSMSEIATRVASERALFGWASNSVTGSLEISNVEALEWLALVEEIPPVLEQEVTSTLPPLEELPDPEGLDTFREEQAAAQAAAADAAEWRATRYASQLAGSNSDQRVALASAIAELMRARRSAAGGASWEASAFEEIIRGAGARWVELAERTDVLIESLEPIARIADGTALALPEGFELYSGRAAAAALLGHLQTGGGLGVGPFRVGVVRRAQRILRSALVDGERPRSILTIERMVATLEFRILRVRAGESWEAFEPLSTAEPFALLAKLKDLRTALDRPLRAIEVRARVLAAIAELPSLEQPEWNRFDEWETVRSAALSIDADVHLRELAEKHRQWTLVASRAAKASSASSVARDLARAIGDLEVGTYATAWSRARDLYEQRTKLDRRSQLGLALASAIPSLDPERVRRETNTDWAQRFERLQEACGWARAEAWLGEALDRTATRDVAASIARQGETIRITTASIGEHMAWKACLNRLTKAQTQHLVAYRLAMKKYGRGTGKYAATSLKGAQEHLEASRTAIPAWIMPTYRVAESMGAISNAFDVVIVDEASQSGIDALFLWWLGKKVVIVGDDEQISPDAVGLELAPVYALRDQLLKGTPLASVITPSTSLFDMGQAVFSGKTYLREHFRCMPEIIAFSNRICYANSPLVPLRQFGVDRLPPLRHTHVPGATETEGTRGRVNKEEARAVVDCIAGLLGDPAYEGKTFGVISLTGDVQARHIERLLLERIGPDEILRRKLKCGDAYAFQGDERDVMFLSMRATPNEKGNRLPALTADAFRQRFNVAASRARDQMWLFHSVTATDLNPVCLRAKLLDHFIHPPEERITDLGDVSDTERHAAFDSLFEQRVYNRIRQRRFGVRPQVKAYGYSIDLVVTGGRTRFAIECDGDEWHGAERYEQDLARQRDLERVGWRFFRLRESEFYLNPDRSIEPLWSRLGEAGIRPRSDPTPSVDRPAGVSVAEVEAVEVAAPTADASEDEGIVRALMEPFTDHAAPFAQKMPEPVHEATAEVGVETERSARASPDVIVGSMPAYASWTSRRVGDARTATERELVDALVEVAHAEGPVLGRRAYRLVVQAGGGQRLTRAVVSPLNRACARAIREGRLKGEPTPGVGGQMSQVLRLPHQPAVRIRSRGPRYLEEIPWSEVRALADDLRTRDSSLTGETLKRRILDAYGRVALTRSASAYLDRCLARSGPGTSATAQLPLGIAIAPEGRLPSAVAKAPPSPPAAMPPTRQPPPHQQPADFIAILARIILRAKALSPAAIGELARTWRDEEAQDERDSVVREALPTRAPREWSVAARAVTATLEDWPRQHGPRSLMPRLPRPLVLDVRTPPFFSDLGRRQHPHQSALSGTRRVKSRRTLSAHTGTGWGHAHSLCAQAIPSAASRWITEGERRCRFPTISP